MNSLWIKIYNHLPSSWKRIVKDAHYYHYYRKQERRITKANELMDEREACFRSKLDRGLETIPIFVISYNRLDYLKRFLGWIKEFGLQNKVIIIDNHSDYKPLLCFYNTIQQEVVYLDKNYGHMAFWESEIFTPYRQDFYIVSDPDIEPVSDCPKDFIRVWFNLLYEHPGIKKAGFSLKIDDLPDTEMKQKIIDHERQFYLVKEKKHNCYVSQIDTTMALYLPDSIDTSDNFLVALRSAEPYQAKHLPWYKNESTITEEDRNYERTKTNGWWDIISKDVHKGN